MQSVENILDFPNEVLILLLEYLHPSDRRVASETCKRFLELWLRDQFIDDRRLVFDKCVLDPDLEPCKTFLKSEREYQHLVFGDVQINFGSEWEKNFSETVKTLEFNCNFVSQPFLWEKFPKLKTIIVNSITALQECYNMPENIDKLVIGPIDRVNNIDTDEVILGQLESDFFPFVPNSFRAEFQLIEENYDLLLKYSNIIQKLGITVDVYAVQTNNFAKIRMENLKHLELNLIYVNHMEKEKILNEIEEQFPSLKHLKLRISDVPPQRNWTFLKELEIYEFSTNHLPSLETFENLELLKIFIYNYNEWIKTKCFFVHEPFLNKNLKTLEINCPTNTECIDCFAAVTQTFPNLETLKTRFIGEEHSTELSKLKLKSLSLIEVSPFIFHQLPNLSEIIIEGCLPENLARWPLMSHLRKLTIYMHELNQSTVKLFENLPALEELTLRFDLIDKQQEHALFQELTKPLKRLKMFNLRNTSLSYPVVEFVDIVISNCSYISKIYYTEQFTNTGDAFTYQVTIKKYSALQRTDIIECAFGDDYIYTDSD